MSQLTFAQVRSRALRLRCPECGVGPLFRGWITMHHHCDHCGLVFERGPGFFLGSTYVNYGFTTLSLTALYMLLHFGLDISNAVLAVPLLIYCVVVPLILFRYARAWWLALDCLFDTPEADLDEANYQRQQAALAERARQQVEPDRTER